MNPVTSFPHYLYRMIQNIPLMMKQLRKTRRIELMQLKPELRIEAGTVAHSGVIGVMRCMGMYTRMSLYTSMSLRYP